MAKYSGNQFSQAANLKSQLDFLGPLDESYVDYASCLDAVAETVASFLAYHL